MTLGADSTTGRFRIGVDIGGTFTDFALFDDALGRARTHKRLTTTNAPARAVIEGIAALTAEAGLAIADVATIVHGTTLVTNAILERKGAPTAMLVTEGFRDTLEMAYERRYDLFDLRLRFPAPIVPRRLRFEVPGRLRADGSEEAPLTLSDALERELRQAVETYGVRAVVVCYLHSYRDDRHEKATERWLAERFPDLAVSASSSIVPFMREYERWTTACINAYVQPVVDAYIADLETGLAGLGFRGHFLVMSSSGGTLTPAFARRFPVRLLESGPAAGALMSARHGRALDEAHLLSFDMGGTTAKGCIVRSGAPLRRYALEVARLHEFKKGSGLPVKIPVIDMIEIGAGGGSLAQIDARGTLRVGPASAGAEPGPACYGRGGEQPTLTDANLVLGYLSPEWFLGGRLRLNEPAARDALRRVVAEPLGISVERAAWGIHEIICEDVARAFRMHASERGVDYRRAAVVVFGGSGPIHGTRVARKLRIPRVICPVAAGVMSAFGLLASPLSFEVVRSRRVALDDLDAAGFAAFAGALAGEATQFLEEAGVPLADASVRLRLDMRYIGQGHELEVPVHEATAQAYNGLARAFTEAYRSTFGLDLGGRAIEIVTWKAEATGPTPGGDAPYPLEQCTGRRVAQKGVRPAHFIELGGFVDCPVYDRYALDQGARLAGPALVEEPESTLVLAPGDTAVVDGASNLVINVGVPS